MNGINSRLKAARPHRWLCLLFFWIQAPSLFAAELVKPASAAPAASADWLPSEFKIEWRGLPVGSADIVAVEWDGQALQYRRSRDGAEERRTLRPTEAMWREFWKEAPHTDVWDWVDPAAGRIHAFPERSWSVAMTHGTNRIHVAGSNGYPGLKVGLRPGGDSVLFYRFAHALDPLVARAIEVEGRYFAGFEASIFSPSTAEFRNQRWWLTGNKDFYERYRKFYPKSETPGLRFAGPEVTVRLRGRLAGPGKYGHLDSYTHELYVDEVLEMKKGVEKKPSAAKR